MFAMDAPAALSNDFLYVLKNAYYNMFDKISRAMAINAWNKPINQFFFWFQLYTSVDQDSTPATFHWRLLKHKRTHVQC